MVATTIFSVEGSAEGEEAEEAEHRELAAVFGHQGERSEGAKGFAGGCHGPISSCLRRDNAKWMPGFRPVPETSLVVSERGLGVL